MGELKADIRSKTQLILDCSSPNPLLHDMQSGGKDYLAVQLVPQDGPDYTCILAVDPTNWTATAVVLNEDQVTQLIEVLSRKRNAIKQETSTDGN